ncbi:MAG: HD domain-containing phosphohydrolase [Trueperaceae bacterium]
MPQARLLAEIAALNKAKQSELFTKPRARSAGKLVVAPYTPATPKVFSPQERLEQARILILDDEEPVLRLLSRVLRDEGYKNILTLQDSFQASNFIKTFRPDLILLDLIMPNSGIDILRQLRSTQHPLDYLPVLTVSGTESQNLRRLAQTAGATDFVTKPFNHLDLSLRVNKELETRFKYKALQDYNRDLEMIVDTRTNEIQEALAMVSQSHEEALQTIGLSLEYRDYETKGHTERVTELSVAIAKQMGLCGEALTDVRWSAYLHDIGKLAIPDHLLLKPTRLTSEEFDVVKGHAVMGQEMLRNISFMPGTVLDVVRHHHEAWNGLGYPDKLAGEDIPLLARIFSVVDVFDALTSHRPYKPAWNPDEAEAEIVKQRGRQFDPAVVDAFLEVRQVKHDQATSIYLS